MFSWVLSLVISQGAKAAHADMDGVGDLLYGVLTGVFPYRAKVIDKNLGRVHPDRTVQDLIAQRNAFYKYLSTLIAEIVAGVDMSADEISKRVRFMDREAIDARIATGKPLVGLIAHQGNWEWVLNACAKQFDIQTIAVYQQLTNPFFDELMRHERGKGGALPTLDRHIIRTALRLGNAKSYGVALVADQAADPKNSYKVDFLGAPTGFFKGGQLLAQKLDLAAFYLELVPDVLPHTYVGRFIPIDGDGTDMITANYVRLLERTILTHPNNYLWSHNRFKNDPAP